YSEEIAFQIDQEVRRIVDECYEKAKRILTENRDKLERVATALLEKESLEGEELTRLLEEQPQAEAPEHPAAPARVPEVKGESAPRPEPGVMKPALKPEAST
ncbi:MAG: cell division protein FtsH, partial [Armatimonadota bacterium]|nr:cell division protein FtsH [Armatimonadota bacterium]